MEAAPIFESSNCTGTGFITPGWASTAHSNGFVPIHFLEGKKLYGLGGAPKAVVIGSQETYVAPNYTCVSFSPYQVTLQPLRFLIDLSTQFQPPFTMR